LRSSGNAGSIQKGQGGEKGQTWQLAKDPKIRQNATLAPLNLGNPLHLWKAQKKGSKV
jgi:hypothetical protein